MGASDFSGVFQEVYYRHAQAVAHVAANRFVYLALLLAAPWAVRHGHILARHLVRSNHAHQCIHGGARTRHHHQTTGVFVESVHNARAWQLGARRVVVQQGIEQGAAPVTRSRVHHQTCGLVNHQQIGIAVDDFYGDFFRPESQALCRGLKRYLHHVAHTHL